MFERFHGSCQSLPCAESAHAEPEINLVQMAEAALNYLIQNPRPALDYECRFGIDLMREKIWPADDEHEVITVGDTDLRMLIEYRYMKEMTGSSVADAVWAGVRERGLSYLDETLGCTLVSGCNNNADRPYFVPWSTGKMLIALCDEFRVTADESLRPLCRGMFEALCRHSVRTEEGICFPSGNGFYWTDGTPAISNENPYSPAMQPEAIAVYAETFKDPQALDFAKELARGEVRGILKDHWILNDIEALSDKQKEQLTHIADVETFYTLPDKSDSLLLVRPDGSFDHHSHMRGHNLWGMAHIAYLTRDPELIEWCRKVLEFYLSRGTDYGWIPESMTYPRRSETCAVADVISTCLYMARLGYTEYYNMAERFVRNYIRKAQFFITDEYKELYRKRHPGEAGERGLAEARRIEGSFLGAVGINDRLWCDTNMDMMGCCPPEGMRSIYSVWKETVIRDGSTVSINMNFSCQRPEADVETLLPQRGGVRVTAKEAGDYRIHLADWAVNDESTVTHAAANDKSTATQMAAGAVTVTVNGAACAPKLVDDYVCLPGIAVGDVIEVSYPLVNFVQKQNIQNCPGEPDREITVYWEGNTVVDVLPHGKYLPFYRR